MLPELTEIVRRRKVLGLTQKELAEKVIIREEKEKKIDKEVTDRGYIAKLETGRLNPSYKKAKNIFDTLEILEEDQLGKKQKVTAGQIHNTPIEYANASERLYDAFQRMVKKAYSQLPVKSINGIVGSITERGINNRIMLSIEDFKSFHVKDVIEEPFPTVGIDIPAVTLIPILQNCQAILTVKGDNVQGIITNTDLIKIFK